MSLTEYAEGFTKDKKQVSDAKWLVDGLVTYLLAGAIAYMVYSLNEGRFENAGLLAVGGTLAMFVFISQSEKKAGPVMWLLTKIFVVCWLVLEVASIAGSYMSASNGHELNQYRELKDSAKSKIAELRQDKIDIENSNVSQSVKIYNKRLKDEAIEKYEAESKLIIDSNEGKYFDDLSKLTGVANIGQIYQITLSALLVLAGSMLVSLRNGIWCNFTLNLHLKQCAKTMAIMKSCELTKTKTQKKTITKPSVDIKGTQTDNPTDLSPFDKHYASACDWVRGHKVGQRVYVGKMKAACEGGANWQQEPIMNGLQSDGILLKKGNGGTSPLYYRKQEVKTDAKQGAINQMHSTRNFLGLQLVGK